MSNTQFHTAISQPRFARYMAACDNDPDKALQLYRANIALSQQMYGIIGIFEVVLRNSIDRHYLTIKGDEWLATAVSENGYLNKSPGCEYAFHCVQEAIQQLGVKYTHDRLIAKMSLGFWSYQFAKREYAAASSTLINVFINRPFDTNQKQVVKNLLKIGELRNRIAHYEPICFADKMNCISTDVVRRRYSLILEMLRWLGYDPKEMLDRIDYVRDAIDAIENLKTDKVSRMLRFILANPLHAYNDV